MLTPKNFNQNVLIEYKRNKQNQPVGVMVAIGRHALGWSLCSPNDKFDKHLGLHIALHRAAQAAELGPDKISKNYLSKIPHSMLDLYDKMYHRARLYFKNTSILPDDSN